MNNINKFAAVARIKWIGISRNTMIMLGPIMTLGIVWVCKILYGINTKGELSPGLVSMLLTIGISTNICSDGFIMVGTLIAEEKEKHTLHTLMTSSITGMQYFIGSILFPFFITMIMNLAILWISGASIPLKAMPIFFIVNASVSIISCVIGMIVGICAKNQMNASLIASPIMMICMMIPMFGNLSEKLHELSGFLFTGVMTEMTSSLATGLDYALKPLDIAVLLGELIISVLLFLLFYKRNGYEKD